MHLFYLAKSTGRVVSFFGGAKLVSFSGRQLTLVHPYWHGCNQLIYLYFGSMAAFETFSGRFSQSPFTEVDFHTEPELL